MSYGADVDRLEHLLGDRMPPPGAERDDVISRARTLILKVLKGWDGDEWADLTRLMISDAVPLEILQDLATVPLRMPGDHLMPYAFAVVRDGCPENSDRVEAFLARQIQLGLPVDARSTLLRGRFKDHHDANLLHALLSAPWGSARTAQFLMNMGLDPAACTREGVSASQLAAESPHAHLAAIPEFQRQPATASAPIESHR